MNVTWSAFARLCIIFLPSGCAIYPVPEDVTGVSTHEIVRQIRCETREATRDLILEELRRQATDGPGHPPNPVALALVQKYDDDPTHETMDSFSPDLFSSYPEIRHFYEVVYSIGIAYNFDLTMDEENDIGTTINSLGSWAPKFLLGFEANFNRGRSNERSFTITDTFKGLMTQLGGVRFGRRYCDGKLVAANYVYPIAGHIGVDKLVKTFVELAVFNALADNDKASPGSAGGPPSIADKLTFTTTIDATLTPNIVFSPVTTTLQMSNVSFTGLARRMDTHQVTVGLAVDSKAIADLTSLRNYLFSTRSGPANGVRAGDGSLSNTVITLNTLTARVNTNAEGLAAFAVDQLKSREIQDGSQSILSRKFFTEDIIHGN